MTCTCLIVGCSRPRVEGDTAFCAPHRYWATVVLADKRYRTEKPPRVQADGSIQAVLL